MIVFSDRILPLKVLVQELLEAGDTEFGLIDGAVEQWERDQVLP